MSLGLDPKLLEILVCPAEDHGTLTVNESDATLVCNTCHRAYPVRNGIPVMLIDEATKK